ncbi:phage terminase large subunit family protein [Paenibacillus sp. GCM10027626]|uniref:phage terminase large subunit family protein n=1 Tax=Paenibacillus sp. GCM10027626 TaxID=3273411 RepID=UPI0036400965
MVAPHSERLFRKLIKLWEPLPELTISQWADENRILTSETSAEPGPWRTDRAPFQREIMDSINNFETVEVAIMASAQLGKSEFLLNMLGFHIDYDPAPIMLMLPNEKLIDYFSKKRLSTMIDASPVLKEKVSEAKSRDSGNTIAEKSFPGGYIAIVGANSAAGLSSRPIRILLCDEVDRYPVSAGDEGDPIMLAMQRTETFYNRKHVFVSTPTIKDASRIEQLYNDSTMEQWNLPCPSCEELQPIEWGRIKFEYEKTHSGEFVVNSTQHACKYCGCLHDEREWKRGEGKWIAQKKHSSRRGFHLNRLISPWSTWRDIVKAFLVAKRDGAETLKVWTNTVLGETWEAEGEKLEEEQLMERCESYPADVPDEVRILTAAVDVQDNRFEIEVIGWGAGKESWGISYHVIHGNPRYAQIWNDLDAFLARTWSNQDGQAFNIAITCVDSGGHFTTEVYRFCAARETRRIYAIKGQGSINGQYVPLLNGHSRTPRERAVLFRLGVDEGKAKVFASLQAEPGQPGYCHFPLGGNYNLDYFRGLTAEKKERKKKMGVTYFQWVKVRDRNEPFDLRVYNTAALEILNPNLDVPVNSPPPVPSKKVTKRKFTKKSSIW